MLERHLETLSEIDDCGNSRHGKCRVAQWLRSVEGLRSAPLAEKLRIVNNDLNSQPYLTDLRNWGMEDYWATPLEFLKRNGDCEDFSIAKFMALKHLGVPDGQMRIVVVNDENLDVGHAVLVVEDNGRSLVLDNQTDQVIESRRILHYRPIYSVNESNWWLHST